MTAHAYAPAGEAVADVSIPLTLTWQQTTDRDADYSAFSGVYPGALGRIYRHDGGELQGQWFWSMTADGYDISRNVGDCNGFERSPRKAAKCVEDAWYASIRGSSLDHAEKRNAYAMVKGWRIGMDCRHSSLSRSVVNAKFTHQVALPDDLCVHRNLTLISAFLEGHGFDCVTTSVQAIWPCGKYEQMRLHRFADAESAAALQRRFGGEMFDPKRDREGGRMRGSWRRKGEYQRVLDLGDLHVPQLLRN